MNFARAITTLARNSILDPEPSIWARQVVREMEERFFAGQDDYQGEWTPAFTRSLARWLDVQANSERVNPALLSALRGLIADSDYVDDGKMPAISAASLTRARQAVAKASTFSETEGKS